MVNKKNKVEEFLKSWDFYSRMPKDLVGANRSNFTISVITVIIWVILFLSELSTYLSPELVSDLQVDVSPSAE